MRRLTIRWAAEAVEKFGALLVFPIQNSPDPPSLWHYFFPGVHMYWRWDESADSRVASLWHLREELSRSGKVVYGKWFRNRATFFSKNVAAAILFQTTQSLGQQTISPIGRHILELLEENSLLSSKVLKKQVMETRGVPSLDFDKAIAELWRRLLIVGYGEVDDGAFPSLAIGAMQVLFEGVCQASAKMTQPRAQQILNGLAGTKFFAQLRKNQMGPRARDLKSTIHYHELIARKR